MPRKNLLARIDAAWGAPERKSFDQPPFWASDTGQYLWGQAQTPTQERIETDFDLYVRLAYKGDGIVFAAINRRQQVFSQARFLWRQFSKGQPGDLFGTPELSLLENPWPNGTTGELLAHMEVDASIAGNFYATTVAHQADPKAPAWFGNASAGKPGRRIARMRPNWVTLVIDAPSGNYYGIDARVVAFMYQPRNVTAAEPLLLLPEEVCHFSPLPDPVARFRGMSWLTPVIKEIEADKAATAHKLGFFERGATPNLVIKGIPAVNKDEFDRLVAMMESRHAGAENAYRTLYLAAGADATAIGADLRQLDFRATQGAGETRVAAAAGVPAAILGISEGLAGSSLNAGNFGAARRLFVDTTIRDNWAKAAASLQVLVKPPNSAVSLWYDARTVPFLREDAKDDAAIRAQEASALRQLTDAGWRPDAAVAFIQTGDISKLVGQHSGLFSVQLLRPGMANGAGVGNSPNSVLSEPVSPNGTPVPA